MLILLIKLIYHWLIAIGTETVICGAYVDVRWSDEKTTPHYYYLSFANDPNDSDTADEYGYPDDEVFYYLSSIKDLVRIVLFGHPHGWRVKALRLNTAHLLE